MAETPRREFLKLAIAGALAAASGALDAARAHAESLGPAAPFAPENVLNMARGLAKSPFKAPRSTLPDPFTNLTFEQYTSIRRNPGSAIWGDDHGGFALEPLNRGFIFATPMELNLVENGQARRVLYDRSLYDFGKLQPPADLADIGFSGVRVLSGGGGQGFQDTAIFQGATFFRSLARGQNLWRHRARPVDSHRRCAGRGISAVSRAVDREAEPRRRRAGHPRAARFGELDRRLPLHPAPRGRDDHRHRIDAVRARRGRPSRPRRDGGMYLFGGLDHRRTDDVRPDVYEVDRSADAHRRRRMDLAAGRQPRNIADLRLRRPESARFRPVAAQPRISTSSATTTRIGRCAPRCGSSRSATGARARCMLLEIPSESENNDNIIAQWRPKAGIDARRDGLASPIVSSGAGRRRPAPTGASSSSSRMGKVGKRWRFIVEFVAELFADPQKAAAVNPAIEANPGQIVSSHAFPYKERRTMRVVFDLDPGSETYSELRLVLKAGRPARQRDMALSMDSVTASAPDHPPLHRRGIAGAGDAARGAAGDAGAIVARSFRAPSGAPGRIRARAHTPWLARLFVFGGALALTVYGAREMYGSSRSARSRRSNGRWSCCSSLNFSWIALAFTLGRARLRLARLSRAASGPLPARSTTKTAVVMPIYNEAPARVFAAMQAICEDVEATASASPSTISSSPTPPIPTSGSPRSARCWRCASACPTRASIYRRRRKNIEPQGGQYRRFRHALGRRLSPDGGARRRQPDDRATRSSASPRRWRPIRTPASSRACR